MLICYIQSWTWVKFCKQSTSIVRISWAFPRYRTIKAMRCFVVLGQDSWVSILCISTGFLCRDLNQKLHKLLKCSVYYSIFRVKNKSAYDTTHLRAAFTNFSLFQCLTRCFISPPKPIGLFLSSVTTGANNEDLFLNIHWCESETIMFSRKHQSADKYNFFFLLFCHTLSLVHWRKGFLDCSLHRRFR